MEANVKSPRRSTARIRGVLGVGAVGLVRPHSEMLCFVNRSGKLGVLYSRSGLEIFTRMTRLFGFGAVTAVASGKAGAWRR
jgi:hypothetical protein